MKVQPTGYNSTIKVGEYEFLTKISHLPLFFVTKMVKVSITLLKPGLNGNSWKKSVIVKHADSRKTVQMLISSYIEETDYFTIK